MCPGDGEKAKELREFPHLRDALISKIQRVVAVVAVLSAQSRFSPVFGRSNNLKTDRKN